MSTIITDSTIATTIPRPDARTEYSDSIQTDGSWDSTWIDGQLLESHPDWDTRVKI